MYVSIFNKVTSVPIGDLEEPGFVGETGCTKKVEEKYNLIFLALNRSL